MGAISFLYLSLNNWLNIFVAFSLSIGFGNAQLQAKLKMVQHILYSGSIHGPKLRELTKNPCHGHMDTMKGFNKLYKVLWKFVILKRKILIEF